MTCSPAPWHALALLGVTLALIGLAGCTPLTDPGAEEKNPLIGDARAKKAAYNYAGAIESLEKALEGNPRLALAHWELGLIHYQNGGDPAAAIYHLEKLLRLRPDWRQADTARQLINASKVELAKSVPLGPQTPAVQQQIDKLTAKVHELANQGAQLEARIQALHLHNQQLALENAQLKDRLRIAVAAPTNPPPSLPLQGGSAASASSAGALAPSTPSRTNDPAPRAVGPPTAPRTHTVRAGDTLSRIARRYGVSLRDLISANPGVRPERLKIGEPLRLPAR
ncbi:MAG TPA: LysM peptidoglycan-binding domain-containing protein [Verrucomicrobiota bacterium]|nr:LysM peptidoglycan-binding domain-containing protein [Verrucomicrobiota bacterium]HNU51753.1 LysM peptidoglycan-binding domain-containing protein [Verrucomicrobiota bacterium]